MDILRKELNAIYESQRLCDEVLDASHIEKYCKTVSAFASVSDEICVITDAAADRCYIYGGRLAQLLGLSDNQSFQSVVASSDEDEIYALMHPEDLPDKRLLEYEYFKFVDPLDSVGKTSYKASCRIRMRCRSGEYATIDNSTQVLNPSPGGKIWLILCRYSLSQHPMPAAGISPVIVCPNTGVVTQLRFDSDRRNILTPREKEILLLIKKGRLSKQIASLLGISINTVNRHRQNIIEKLSVSNSAEAVAAALAMKLL